MRVLTFLPLALLVLAGCGGGGRSKRGETRLNVKAVWPVATARVIPTAAQSVRVQVLQGSTVVNEAILSPSAPSTSFAEVPVGAVTVKATAYPTAGGTGTAMAFGQVARTVVAGSTDSVDLTMASTIDHLAITPSTLSIAIGGTQQLVATAYDASNAVVLTAPGDVVWSASGLLVSVGSTGLLQGISVGVGSVTATETLSGKSATLPVSVHL